MQKMIRSAYLGAVFVPVFVAACAPAAAGTVSASVSDANGAPVADAVIYAVALGPTPAAAPRPAIMDQVNKEYLPLVVPVQVGAAVTFPNKDNIRHQVYSFSPAKVFEMKLYAGTPAKPVVFDKPGAVVLGCNIHDWMVGYVYVVDTPYFAKTGKAGSARLNALPAGDYKVRVWHPYMGAEPALLTLKVAEGTTAQASFRLELSAPQKVSPAGK